MLSLIVVIKSIDNAGAWWQLIEASARDLEVRNVRSNSYGRKAIQSSAWGCS